MMKKSTKNFQSCLFRRVAGRATLSHSTLDSFTQFAICPNGNCSFPGSSSHLHTSQSLGLFLDPDLVRFCSLDRHCHQGTRATIGTLSRHCCTLCAFGLVPPLCQVQTYNSKGLCLASVCCVALGECHVVAHHGLVVAVDAAVVDAVVAQMRSLLRSLRAGQSLGLGLVG